MLIKNIKAKNFKTYLNLDLDISVDPEKPIILIGGESGGGKTTFFEAIYGALYGLKINSERQFRELLNAGAGPDQEQKIVLELKFSGKVLNQEQDYVLTRTYILNPNNQPVESVRLNMNGTIFTYGTATPTNQRIEQEAQVNKIIKANLPQELSRYFLFDAMEAGNLLKEDQLNRVIKENIENVMGFNKYLQMAKASEALHNQYTAQRLQVENERQEYLQLLESKRSMEAQLENIEFDLQNALQYSVANKELYDNLKSGLNQETTIKSKIEQTQGQIENTLKKESLYKTEIESFVKEIELNVVVPKLLEAIKSEVNLILKAKEEQLKQDHININPEQVEAISASILDYLKSNHLILKDISLEELVNAVMAEGSVDGKEDPYAFLDFSDVKALEQLMEIKSANVFPRLHQQQLELNIALDQVPVWENQIETLKAQISGRDYNLLKSYEDNESKIKRLQADIEDLKGEIKKVDKKLHQFDIQISQEPDPRYETLGKLKGFFEDVANQLLKVKKQQLELKMKQDLNRLIPVYENQINRVELSENLSNLTFKVFHNHGNEIYLNQLNTASKQVVVQVLLKALHEFGDYDPPVMIDTVMGVLSEESRTRVLEYYFPELSHQTILLSSDAEIRKGADWDKIEPFVSKAFTLKRDRERQLTEIVSGYFTK
ncbi:AAA family ATPase [Shivajiella indica]|uniref:AAA family ATPase n=1 Tax=Shivajiella indica TaxID=872115 RepID=A0ABW5BAW6_9BACT